MLGVALPVGVLVGGVYALKHGSEVINNLSDEGKMEGFLNLGQKTAEIANSTKIPLLCEQTNDLLNLTECVENLGQSGHQILGGLLHIYREFTQMDLNSLTHSPDLYIGAIGVVATIFLTKQLAEFFPNQNRA